MSDNSSRSGDFSAKHYKKVGNSNSSENWIASSFAKIEQSSIVEFWIGINGQTSTAPNRGCSPLCFVMSIYSYAAFITLNAANFTDSGSPAIVKTVLL